MHDHARQLARRFGADFLEIRLCHGTRTHAHIGENPAIPDRAAVEETRITAGSVRLVCDGAWGFATFTDCDAPNAIETHARAAVEFARAAAKFGAGTIALASVEPAVIHLPETPATAASIPSPTEIATAMQDYAARTCARGAAISGHRGRFTLSRWAHELGNSEGTHIRRDALDAAFVFAVSAGDGPARVRLAVEAGSSADARAVLLGHEHALDAKIEAAIAAATAPPARGGNWPVVLNPHAAGTFAHETIGHLAEADVAASDAIARAFLTPGHAIAGEWLTVMDTGSMAGSRGFVPVDDEGVPAREAPLIEAGRVVGKLHTRETAAIFGEIPTGNGRATDAVSWPLPRMRTTCISPHTTPVADLIAGIDAGVYAVDGVAGETAGGMFSLTVAEAFAIRDGRLAERLRGVRLTGHLAATLRAIDAVGNDFRVVETFGACEKRGGAPIPVAVGAPHIRVRNLTVEPL